MNGALASSWVGLMRHGTAWYAGMPTEARSEVHPELTDAGAHSASAVAQRFKELLDEVGCDPGAVAVYDVGTPQSAATARIVREELNPGRDLDPPPSLDQLAPQALATHTTSLDALQATWKAVAEAMSHDEVERYVIVGHDPQMSWLLHLLGGSDTTWHTLSTGELMLLERQPDSTPESPRYRRPRFVFSPTDAASAEELRTKIRSKMDTAKGLGTFLTALITFAATQVLDRDNASTLSMWLAGVGLTAAVLYFVTLFFYDELLMPKRFWPSALPRRQGAKPAETRHVLRPPGPDVWVLYENMLRVWTRAFVPATFLAGAGVVAITLALADPSGWSWLVAATAVAMVATIGMAVRHLARPRLGVND